MRRAGFLVAPADKASGLIGPLFSTARGTAKPDGSEAYLDGGFVSTRSRRGGE